MRDYFYASLFALALMGVFAVFLFVIPVLISNMSALAFWSAWGVVCFIILFRAGLFYIREMRKIRAREPKS